MSDLIDCYIPWGFFYVGIYLALLTTDRMWHKDNF